MNDQGEERRSFEHGQVDGTYDVECLKELGMIYTEVGYVTREVVFVLRRGIHLTQRVSNEMLKERGDRLTFTGRMG